MKIVLLRHGLTEANEKHLYCGSTDLPLSPAGRAALRRLEMPAPGTRFISSGMRRCNETLEALFGAVAYETEPDFREIDFGDFEMKDYETLRNDSAYRAWLAGDNEKNTPPHGESGEEMTRRVLAAFARVTEDGRDAVIVTHGGVIAAIMARPERRRICDRKRGIYADFSVRIDEKPLKARRCACIIKLL